MSFILETKLVWGIVPEKALIPHTDLRNAKFRIRLRSKSAGVVYVRTDQKTSKHYLEDKGDHWSIGVELASNVRKPRLTWQS